MEWKRQNLIDKDIMSVSAIEGMQHVSAVGKDVKCIHISLVCNPVPQINSPFIPVSFFKFIPFTLEIKAIQRFGVIRLTEIYHILHYRYIQQRVPGQFCKRDKS